MTHDDALESLAASGHPHLWRFRELCADDVDMERRDGYRGLVIRLALGQSPPPAPVAVDYAAAPATHSRGCCG